MSPESDKKIITAGKAVAIGILWLIPLVIFVTAFSWGWQPVWSAWGLRPELPTFLDLRSVTAGMQTVHDGGDPLIANPHDPRQRPLNYPRIWLYLFSELRINDHNLSGVAIAFCGLYLVAISKLILMTEGLADAFTILVAGLSLAPLAAVERGNNELLVFAIVFWGTLVAREPMKSGAFGLTALLKIYPFVAIVIHAMRKRAKERIGPALVAMAVLAIFVFRWREIEALGRATPISSLGTWGVLSLYMQGLASNGKLAGGVAACCTWLILVLVVRNAWFGRSQVDVSGLNSKAEEMFSVFGGIYAFTFIVGCSWCYRLMFLIPTLPFAFEMIRRSRKALLGWIYIALVLVAENSLGVPQLGIPRHCETIVNDVSTFALVLIVLTILTEQARNIFERTRSKAGDFSTLGEVPHST